MADYDNTNSIVLFPNYKHEDGDKLPVMTGTVNVEGKDYKISLWGKVSSKGGKFLAGKIQDADAWKKKEGASYPKKEEHTSPPAKINNDEMPF